MGTIDPNDIVTADLWEDTGAQNLARITGGDGSNITQADVSAIARKVFDLSGATPGTAIDTSAPVVASTIYDTLQTDDRWSGDSTGFNFADTVASTILTTGNHRYRVEYILTPTSGQPYAVVWELYARALRSS